MRSQALYADFWTHHFSPIEGNDLNAADDASENEMLLLQKASSYEVFSELNICLITDRVDHRDWLPSSTWIWCVEMSEI